MLRLLLTLAGLNAALVGVTWIRYGAPQPPWIALEALLVTGALALAPARRWSAAVAWGAGIALAVLLVAAVAERLTVLSLARPLNIYLDWRLLPALHDLLGGQSGGGAVLAALVLAAAALAAAAVAWGCARGLGALRATATGGPARTTAIALLAAGVLGAAAVPALPGAVVGAPGWTFAAEQAHIALETRAEGQRFAARLAEADGDDPVALPALADTDVILAFVESYGTSALDDPRYAPVVRPELRRAQERLDAAGLHVASGRVVAPSQGGQSWLGHGSVLSGLWLDSQIRYDLMLTSERPTLVDDLEATGHESIAVMPAITQPWAAAERLGYDRLLDATSIDYAGPPLNWVTMPDQYTWTVVERARRAAAGPVFVEAALISSHAPWVPVLPVLEWERIDDGAVFGQWADAGERPEVLWRDAERVRAHFARQLAYAVRVAGEYAARHVDEDTLLILLGDHQPAPLITGEDAPRTVPVHVVSGDPDLVAPFRARGLAAGMQPPVDGEAPRMDVLRGWLHAAYGERARMAGTGGAREYP